MSLWAWRHGRHVTELKSTRIFTTFPICTLEATLLITNAFLIQFRKKRLPMDFALFRDYDGLSAPGH